MRMKWWKGIGGRMMGRQPGNVGSLMATGICLLAMCVMMFSYLDTEQLVQQKTDVNQLARKYILRMETIGFLTPEDRAALTAELQRMGVTDILYEGTTEAAVGYGEEICLQISGRLKGEYAFSEKRVSTAKN